MYLTAQRVVSPKSHKTGVNTYKYVHGAAWPGPVPDEFLPDVNPGELALQSVVLTPPGNRVLSYLDVVLPDGADPQEVRNFLLSLKWALPTQSLPVSRRLENGFARFHMAKLSIPATTELAALAGRLALQYFPMA
jgi:hypothetical protein